MFCSKCGADIGSAIGHCDSCKQAVQDQRAVGLDTARARVQDSLQPTAVRTDLSQDFPYNIISSPSLMSLISLFVFVLITTVVFALHPKGELLPSAGVSFLVMILLVCIGGWLTMWFELFQDEPLICFIAIIIPVCVYYILVTYPERAWKPFAIHLGTGILLFVLLRVFDSSLGDYITQLLIATGSKAS